MASSPGASTRLTAVLRSLSRAISWHRRLLAAGLASAAVVVALDVLAPPTPPTEPVVVAARDLIGGAPLSSADLAIRRVPPAVAPAGASAAPAELVGQVLAAPVRRGETITDIRLVDGALAGGYGNGLVGAPVRIADAAAVALLEPGDRVDVLAPDPRGERVTAVVVERAPVAAIPQVGDDAGVVAGGALVVLAVSPEAAQDLALRAATGPLVVTLRE